MDELLARAMHGVDPNAPDAFWRVFLNLIALVPWGALLWWNLFFIVVGALIGRWRGRTGEGLVWAFVLGPIGWLVVLRRPRRRPPPPLPGQRRPG